MDDSNIRSGSGTKFPVVRKLMKEQEVFVHEEINGWSKIDLDEKWINKKYITHLK